MDSVENTQQSSLNDTLPLSESLRLFGDIASQIEQGANITLNIRSNFLYEVADRIDELENDEIHIQCGDETVVIDGGLAYITIKNAVTEYVNKAIKEYISERE